MRTPIRTLVALAAGAVLFADLAAGTAEAQLFRRRGRADRFPTPYTPYTVPYPFGDGTYTYRPSNFYNPGGYYYPGAVGGAGAGGYAVANNAGGYTPSTAGVFNPAGTRTGPATEAYGPYYPLRGVGTGHIRVELPVADARLSLNGTPLDGTGYERHLYVSDVTPGYAHSFPITATWTKNGKTVTETRTVVLDGYGTGLANFFVPDESPTGVVPAGGTTPPASLLPEPAERK